ncbi:MAG TPA: hypothetical protein VFE96_05000, partial [Candidatus Bathyarchaeia archaeon]|nr:hypothetical protein [Candidatus Bathyarchaeia archaeon]
SVTHEIAYHTPAQFFKDGLNASQVLNRKSMVWSFAKYPLFLRHGRKRTSYYTQFLKGMLTGIVEGPGPTQGTNVKKERTNGEVPKAS